MRRPLAAILACTLAAAFALSRSLPAQAAPATLTIDANKPLHPVSPTLYGMMTEEINYSYDGGLYAEMVRNRTFTDRGWAGIGRWFLDSTGNAHASLKYDATTGPSEALSGSVRIDVTEADAASPAGVRNDGWWGMALQPNTTYKGSLYARTEGTANIGVSLVSDLTGQPVATATVTGVSPAWKQYTFTLKTGSIAASTTNHLLLSFPQAGKVWIDLISLFPPTYNNRPNGNRPDLMEMMAGMHPKFLRLPGGNYLEGDQIDERFDWKLTLGPLVDRPTHRGPWSYHSRNSSRPMPSLDW